MSDMPVEQRLVDAWTLEFSQTSHVVAARKDYLRSVKAVIRSDWPVLAALLDELSLKQMEKDVNNT